MRFRRFSLVAVSLALVLCGGAQATATEPAQKAPEVWSGQPLEIGSTYVVLGGWIKPRGQETNFYFQVGKTKSYGMEPKLSEELFVGYRNYPALETFPFLKPRTIYHYRLVAHTRSGTTYGKDKTFRTGRP
jgi:hypothetical protein